MSAQRPEQLRLNPLAFPSETDARFRLLIVAALALAITIGSVLPVVIDPSGPGIRIDLVLTPHDPAPVQYAARVRAAALHNLGLVLRYLAPPGAIIAGMALIACARYRPHPRRLLKRYRLTLLSQAVDARFIEVVERLAARAGVSPVPEIMSGQGIRVSGSGQAFGLPGRYILRLEGNLRLRLRKRPTEAQAVVLHELAHIANRDIGRLYGAEALWAATVWMTLVPLLLLFGFHFVAGQLEHVNAAGQLDVGWLASALLTLLELCARCGALLLVIALARAGLLRARELHADWRAASWGAAEGLAAVLREEQAHTPAARRRWARWASWLDLHPPPTERLQTLYEPERLFRIAPDLALTVGMLFGILAVGLVPLLPGLIIGVASTAVFVTAELSWVSAAALAQFVTLAYPLSGLLVATVLLGVATLLVGTLGLQVQRWAMAGLVSGRRGGETRILVRVAAELSVGIEVGLLVVPNSQFTPHTVREIMSIALWLLCVLVGVWFGLMYTRSLTLRALRSYAGKAQPVWRQRFIRYALSALCGAGAVPLGLIRVQLARSVPVDSLVFLTPTLIIVILAALLLSAVIVALCEAALLLGRIVAPPRCACGRSVEHAMVDARCPTCRRMFWPWLLSDSSELTAPPEHFGAMVRGSD